MCVSDEWAVVEQPPTTLIVVTRVWEFMHSLALPASLQLDQQYQPCQQASLMMTNTSLTWSTLIGSMLTMSSTALTKSLQIHQLWIYQNSHNSIEFHHITDKYMFNLWLLYWRFCFIVVTATYNELRVALNLWHQQVCWFTRLFNTSHSHFSLINSFN